MAKNVQQFIDAYANRAIGNGMEEGRAWAEAANMADRALAMGHITGDDFEMRAAADRAEAFGVRAEAFGVRATPVPQVRQESYGDYAKRLVGAGSRPATLSTPASREKSHRLAAVRGSDTYRNEFDDAWDIGGPGRAPYLSPQGWDDLDGAVYAAKDAVRLAQKSQLSGLSTWSSTQKLAEAEATLAALEEARRRKRPSLSPGSGASRRREDEAALGESMPMPPVKTYSR